MRTWMEPRARRLGQMDDNGATGLEITNRQAQTA